MPQEVTETNDGFIVGADPKEPPRQVADWSPGPQQQTVAPPPPQAPQPSYTAEDIEKARREEKDKLYGRIESMSDELRTLQQEREAREAEARAQQEAEEAARRAAEEEAMSLQQRMEARDAEWQSRLAELEERYESDKAVFDRERAFIALEEYKTRRVHAESEAILPELLDLVRGNNEEEIEASIEEMKARTAAIMSQVEQVVGQQRQQMRGAAPTAPPVGPLEQQPQYESLTPADVASMDMETYRRHRDGLLQATGRQYRGR
jgi:DNA repair exonuclease SbcCD ATPase subunit